MTISETVVGQSSSYRRGLVLGLTMAEVILLIIFALLMALATVWNAEHQKGIELAKLNVGLQKRINELETTSAVAPPSEDERRAREAFRDALKATTPEHLQQILEQIAAGQDAVLSSAAEANYLLQIRDTLRAGRGTEIDKAWRDLVAASSVQDVGAKIAVAEASGFVVGKDDPKKVGRWIKLGKQVEAKGEHDWPPIINLREAEGYTFTRNRADLTPSFEEKLRSAIIPQLLELTARYRVDVIEIVGHTDEQAIAPRPSNLDTMLLGAVIGGEPVGGLVHGDNAGLGLARAASVVRTLQMDGRLAQQGYRVLPLSGGQLIATDERLTAGGGGDAPNRRRIEIRLRRSQESLGRR